MKILDNYIGRTVIVSTVITFVAVLALIGFFELMNELDNVGRGDYQTRDVLFYVLLILPRMAYEIFPVVVLLGSLIGLGALASNSELIAMRANGISLSRIIWSVLRVGLLGIVFVVVVGEVIAPHSEQYAERMKMEKIAKQITLQTRYGFWSRDGNSFINIRQILPGSELRQIYIYEFSDDRELLTSTYAASAEYQEDRWLLKGIRQSRITDNRIVSRKIPQATWESMISPKILDVVVVKPNMLPIWDLHQYINFMRKNGQEVTVYEVAFWSKLLMPVMTLIMVFLSVPFVFGVLRSVGIGQRIFVGALVGLGFFLLNRVFGHMAIVYELSPLLVASLPAILFLSISIWFTRRIT
jgi:lipopolysaccharide export system permease protein